jgi:hypothetical protein
MKKNYFVVYSVFFFHPENVFSLFSAILFLFSAFVCEEGGKRQKNEITSEALHHAPSLNQAVHK